MCLLSTDLCRIAGTADTPETQIDPETFVGTRMERDFVHQELFVGAIPKMTTSQSTKEAAHFQR